ncbi:YrhB domain-containing protein [Amycolatopsis suaedae]|uniref:ADP-ribosylglycohydrolase n=1 Tax=Amycolatopsis suaedae TaxID=2510978 RepID=A0A4Q7JCH6_9PSEU|nr:YrhB domain-containing protein [Amycolatopsis suaedae]RZQ65019.1 ADP-ribosylglycohydrolase [Amycolatopsis suaedae]
MGKAVPATMNQLTAEQAISRVETWLREHPDGDRTVGPSALRVRTEHVVRSGKGWAVPYNAAAYLDRTDIGKGLFPTPVLFVPDDGGEPRHFAAAMTPPEPEPVPVVDPEFDPALLPWLDETPEWAVMYWTEPTGEIRKNPKYHTGPRWRGLPEARTTAEKLWHYKIVDWLTEDQFLRQLADTELLFLVDDNGEYLADVRHRVLAYTSSQQIPPDVTRWRRATPRQVWQRQNEITGDQPAWLELNLNRPGGERLTTLGQYINGTKAPDSPAPVDEVSPEVSAPVTEAATALAAEFQLDPPRVLSGTLPSVAAVARRYGYELTTEECLSYARGFAIRFRNLRAPHTGATPEWPEDLWANGLVAHIDSAGKPNPVPWTFGKFPVQPLPVEGSNYAWNRVLGAYIGFALGDSIGTVFDEAGAWNGEPLPRGGLTRQALFQTEAVIRGIPPVNETATVPAALPAVGRPEGWLNAVTAGTGPAPQEYSTLLATALAATTAGGTPVDGIDLAYVQAVARELIGAAAGPELTEDVDLLVTLLHMLFRRDSGAGLEVPPSPMLQVLLLMRDEPDGSPLRARLKAVVDMRVNRAANRSEQIETLGDGRTPRSVLDRALFAVLAEGTDPRAALRLAAGQSGRSSVTCAITGALLGGCYGVPGLPADWVALLPHLGLIDNIAEDVFRYFHRFGVGREPDRQADWQKRYPKAY